MSERRNKPSDDMDSANTSVEQTTPQIPARKTSSTYTKSKQLGVAKYPLPLDSPAYDACVIQAVSISALTWPRSEEDNDATDDGASAFSIPRAMAPMRGRGTIRRGGATGASSALASSALLSESDTGVDSPTYDGDVESVSTVAAAPSTGTASPRSALSSLPSSAFHGDASMQITPPRSIAPLPPAQGWVGMQITEPTPTGEVQAMFDPASLTPDDIQKFVQGAMEKTKGGPCEIRPPPTGRPVRVYADGEHVLANERG